MSSGTLTRSAALGIAAALLAASAAASATAATRPVKVPGKLSPVLRRLSAPALRGSSHARQARAAGVAVSGPGSFVRRGNRVLVEVGFDRGAVARRDQLRAAGAQVLAASRPYQVVTATAAPADLPALTTVPGVESVSPVREPILREVDCEGGAAISEGVAQLHAGGSEEKEEARWKFGTRGAGVTVGVLSDSFDEATEAADESGPVATKAKEDEETADLPGAPLNTCGGQELPVGLVGEDFKSSESSDEGRAMLQIVHDVAPEAKLAFATAFTGETAFAENIEKLQEAGAEVIVDDVSYFEEPFFQEGPIGNAIRAVTEKGATYLTAAGNDNLFDGEGHEIASWEAPAFRDSGKCPAAIAQGPGLNASHCMDFDPEAPSDDEFGIRVEPEETLTVDLQWAESRHGVGTDLDAYLLDSSGNVVAASLENNPSHGQPVEILQWENPSSSTRLVDLAINRFSGGNPRLKFILLENGGGVAGTEYPTSGGGDVVGPSIFGHSAAADAIAVGAVKYNVDPEAASAAPERYSSRGPATLYFAPVEAAGASEKLLSPELVSKPDVAATDCGQTTFFAHVYTGQGPAWRFCGTSAAAPHAAGVVALMKSKVPGATPEELRTALTGTATPFASFGPCAMGAGLVEAVGALEAVQGGPTVGPGSCPVPEASGLVVKAPGNWDAEVPVTPEPPAPTAPATSIRLHPAAVVRRARPPAKLVFAFAADQSGVSFVCRIDRAANFSPCPKRLVRRFGVGAHVVRVRARGSSGLLDPTPAVFRFRVKRVD
ncbi:MAG TPA: S8 family serine peptidase [Solirubrobacterales bacterium]|nr:S8 family serine peptidase [Solirubrobacterales bacterium]